MNFFGKSILRRVFIYFALFIALISAGLFYLYSFRLESISVTVFVWSLLVFLIFFFLVYFYEIVRPLRIILAQMKALLTGKKYQRIYTRRVDEVGIIAHFFNEVTASFEKVSTDISEGRRMMSELEIASAIQKDILPPQNPGVAGLDIVAKTRPAVELGGDNFDFITVGNNTFIYVGDVTGHGVPAAIIMTMVNTLIHTLAEIYDNAYEIVVRTNKQIKSSIKSTMFMTLLMMRWNHTQQKMSYVGAGHEHVVVYRANTGRCEVKPTGGVALGMIADNSKLIKETDLPLAKDDVVILYTDGLTEGRNMAGEMYTLERLTKAVELFAPQYGSDGIVHHVALDYSRFVENHLQDDDVTLIAMKCVGAGAAIGVGTGGETQTAGLSATSWMAENEAAEVSTTSNK